MTSVFIIVSYILTSRCILFLVYYVAIMLSISVSCQATHTRYLLIGCLKVNEVKHGAHNRCDGSLVSKHHLESMHPSRMYDVAGAWRPYAV